MSEILKYLRFLVPDPPWFLGVKKTRRINLVDPLRQKKE